MANTRISDLTASASNLAASDLVPVVQTPGVGPVKMTGTQIKTGIIGAGSVSIASGKTFTASNTLTLAGTDSTTMTFPSTSATIARTDAGNTFTGAQTFSVGTVNGTGLDISQTWTGTGTYTGLKYNVGTDSGPSNAASLLLDLQVGGASQLNVNKAGAVFNAGGGYYNSVYGTGAGFEVNSIGRVGIKAGSIGYMSFHAGQINFPQGSVSFGGGYMGSSQGDTILTRAAAATLQLGAADAAAPVAQTLQVQSVVAGTSNTAGANFTINGSKGTGTGAGGSIIFQVAPAGSSGTAQNAYATALTIASDRSATFASGITLAGTNPILSIGGGTLLLNNDISLGARANGIFIVSSGGAYTFSPSTAYNASPDLFLYRDAANTLALRNGASRQQFNVYGSYSSAADYNRLEFYGGDGSGNCSIQAANAGTGATASLYINIANNSGLIRFLTNSTVRWDINASGHFVAGADNTYDIGASGTTSRVRTIYSGGGYSAASPTIKTADYSQGIHDYSLIFNGSGSITLTLLAAATYPGKILYVKTIAAQTVVSASSNVKPIDTDTAGTAILAATAGKWAMLQSDGTNWVIMAQG